MSEILEILQQLLKDLRFFDFTGHWTSARREYINGFFHDCFKMAVEQLNPEICELIGAFIGDGYLTNSGKTYTFGISGNRQLDEDYLKNRVKSLIKRNFPFTEPRLHYRSDENTLMLRVNSKRFYEFFVSLGFKKGKKSKTVKIPEVITENDSYMNATIRGIFDTDGCVFFDKRASYKKPYPRVTLQMVSPGLIKQLQTYLSKHFMVYSHDYHRYGEYRGCVEIYGSRQLESFLKKIGLSNRRHLSKIQIASVAQPVVAPEFKEKPLIRKTLV